MLSLHAPISRLHAHIVVGLSVALAASPPTYADHHDGPPYVQVTGRAELGVDPDRYVWKITLVHDGPDPLTLKNESDQQVSVVAEVCDELDVPEQRVDVGPLSISRRFRTDPQTERRVFEGYRFRRFVTVEQSDLDAFDAMLTGLVEARAAFEVEAGHSQEDELRRKAMRDAVADAQRRAELLADGFGVRLDKPYRIEPDFGDRKIFGGGGGGGSSFGSDPGSLQPSRFAVKARVDVRYGIEP